MKPPYLIQRGTINKPLVDGHLSKVVSLDYMGSSEFEFGALPGSLRELHNKAGDLKLTVESRIVHGDKPLRVLHALAPTEYEEYVQYLITLREGKLTTKESSQFTQHEMVPSHWRADVWWDIENHVFWSFHKPFMNRLKDTLVASWNYMDVRKILRVSQ